MVANEEQQRQQTETETKGQAGAAAPLGGEASSAPAPTTTEGANQPQHGTAPTSGAQEVQKANYPGEDPNSSRSLGLGNFKVLNDGLIQMLLVIHCDVESICALNQCSRSWYVHTLDHELWRKISMRNWNFQTGRFPWKNRWKETALTIRDVNLYRKRMAAEGKEADEAVIAELEARIPLYVPPATPFYSFKIDDPNFLSGFNGMLMHRKWYRSRYPMDMLDLPYSHLERRSAKELTLQQFKEEYEIPGKPLLITDLMDDWPAMKEWAPEVLLKRFGDKVFKMTHKHEGKRLRMKIADYFNYWRSQDDSDPLYLFESHFYKKAPEMGSEYEEPIYFREDLFAELKKRPFHKWTIIGPARTGTSFHIDPLNTSAWNALVSGRKRWALYPPNWPSAPGAISLHPDDYFDSEVEPLAWLLEHYPFLSPEYKPWECVQRAGEVIFVPGGWWHMVLNIDETVAVTQNFVNEVNFPNVWGELDLLAEGEASDDEDRMLQEEWYEILKSTRPHLLEKVEYWKDRVDDEEEETTQEEEVKPSVPGTPRVPIPALALGELPSQGPQSWVEQPLEQIKINSSRDFAAASPAVSG